MTVVSSTNSAWRLTSIPKRVAVTPSSEARRGARDDGFPEAFLEKDKVEFVEAYEAVTDGETRRGVESVLDFTVESDDDTPVAVAVRHESGALTFHAAAERVVTPAGGTRRSGATAKSTGETLHHFRITVPERLAAGRRGLVSKVIKFFVLKIVDKAVDAAIPVLVRAWEEHKFKTQKISEGFVKISMAGGQWTHERVAPRKAPTPSGRALLLIHGTFSDTRSSYVNLAKTDFLARAAELYGDQIYGFEHFTMSKTPEENARELLAALTEPVEFDVVTYSRGGLVLRNLLERASVFGPAITNFRVAHTVLVACPNQGTPLATPDRWRQTVGWLATILDYLPDNPFTTAASFITEAIVWIAKKAGGNVPGLSAMNGSGDMIGDIQAAQTGNLSYSALAANFVPDDNLLQMMADVGIDAFFGSANDLVVPSEGSWRVDPDTLPRIVPAARVACFGPGGNVPSVVAGANHVNFFGRRETADFILRAMQGQPQGLAPLDLDATLPSGLRRRGGGGAGQAEDGGGVSGVGGGQDKTGPSGPAGFDAETTGISVTPSVFSDAFHIAILPPLDYLDDGKEDDDQDDDTPAPVKDRPDSFLVMASYAGGRVIAPMGVRGLAGGQRWRRLIRYERELKAFASGKAGARKPTRESLLNYGRLLFDELFPANIRRLYDVARARSAGGRLTVVFTSAIPWLAQVPWELAFDRTLGSFLVTEEVEFIRNPLTAEPAEVLLPSTGRIRILVVVAQPLDQVELSGAEEQRRIRQSFAALERTGLVTIVVLDHATPLRLHEYVRMHPVDIIHFIGHGAYDEQAKAGYLIFESYNGTSQRVYARSMREILTGRNVRLVFLNACETGRSRNGELLDFNTGVAQALVGSGVNAVIANQYVVMDYTAVGFAQHLYWGLARGETIGCAAREARIALIYESGDPESTIDWAVPVVYARDPMARLTTRIAADMALSPSPQAPTPPIRTTAASSGAGASPPQAPGAGLGLSVAVWDMENAYPRLNTVLAKLNAVQDTYRFQSVSLGAPVGALQQTQNGMELYADVAEPRIRAELQQLGAECLICLTPRRIMFDEDGVRKTGYYVWWREASTDPANGKYAIISVDIAGLTDPERPGERAMANTLALALLGAGTDIDTHETGDHNCPLYRNNEVDLDVIFGEQHLDKGCLKLLQDRADLPAIQAILRAFDDVRPADAGAPQ